MERTHLRPRLPWPTVLGAVLLLLAQGCTRTPDVASGHPVDLTLHDFRISATTTQVAEGSILFHVRNAAPATHEFLVVRTDLPADGLPLGPDGLRVDEEALHSVGEISQVDAGTTGSLALRLPPGRYVFFCNLDGHYLGGMHGVLQVRSDG
jgi:uncharacterized cupredoxin-like copper-binding protein